jgi:hypothetical protein
MYNIGYLKTKQRYVVARRNSGLGDNLLNAAHAWHYAKYTNRILAIDWTFSRFVKDKRKNAFSIFFQVPANIEQVPIIANDHTGLFSMFITNLINFFCLEKKPYLTIAYAFRKVLIRILRNASKSRNLETLEKKNELLFSLRQNRMNDAILSKRDFNDRFVLFKDCHNVLTKHELKPFFDGLKLSGKLSALYNEFVINHFHGKKIIGIHVRYYNSTLPFCNHTPYWENSDDSLMIIKQMINYAIRKINVDNYVLFLSTDSALVNEFVKKEFQRVITYPKEFGSFKAAELHVERATQSAIPTVLEMFLLAHSDILVRYPPSKSWFSYYGSIYAKEEII